MKKILLLIAILVAGNVSAHDLKLWYQKPAEKWTDALPVGNGRLGAMIYGIPANEIIQINEETIWCGGPHNNVNYNAKDHLGEIRQLLFQNRRKESMDLCNKYILTPGPCGMPYQTAGSLLLDFDIKQYSNYYRDLDLENAVATTKFEANGVEYKREALVSFNDQVIVLHLTASKDGCISFGAKYSLPYDQNKIFGAKASAVNSNSAEMQIGCTTDDYNGIKGQVRFLNKAIVKTDGGNVKANGAEIEVENANSVTIYISVGTNYVNWDDISGDENITSGKPLLSLRKWDKIKEDNIKYYQKQFNAVSLDLGTNEQVKKPTDIRLEEFNSAFDPQFVELYFHYARYLLISSSQPGNQPSNLQGIWNDQLDPRWGSKFTTNINLQMCYWPAYVCGLPQNFLPVHRCL